MNLMRRILPLPFQASLDFFSPFLDERIKRMAFNTVSLTGKFSLVTTVTISIILITVSAFSIYTARQNQRDMLDTFIAKIDDMNLSRIAEKKQLVKEKVEAMVNLMEKSAINLINSYDFESVHEIALSGIQDSWIDYVIFYDSSDEKIGGGKNDQEATDVITRDIMYEKSLLGKIEIGINYSSLEEQTIILNQQARKASVAAEQKGALELKKLSYLIGAISLCGLVVLCSIIILMFKGVVIKPFSRVVSVLSSVASQVNNAAEEVAIASKALADGAVTQALALEETSASIEENTSMTRQNADNATQANSLMHRNGEVLKKAVNSMSEPTEAMEEIANAGNDTQYNTAHAEETTASADVLSNEADRLTTIIDELEGILHGNSETVAVEGKPITIPLRNTLHNQSPWVV
jgi:hypothetical protein